MAWMLDTEISGFCFESALLSGNAANRPISIYRCMAVLQLFCCAAWFRTWHTAPFARQPPTRSATGG